LVDIRKYIPIVAIGILISVWSAPTFGQTSGSPVSEPVVSLEANRQEIRVGDDVEITMRLVYPIRYEILGKVSFPKVEGLKQLGIDKMGVFVSTTQRQEDTTRTFQALEPGAFVIEPIKVGFRKPEGGKVDVESNGLTIVVLEAGAPQEGLRDIKGLKPIKRPIDWLLILTIAAIALALILIVLVITGRRARPAVAQLPFPYKNIEEEYIRQLQALAIPDEYDSEAVKKIYLTMSELVRTYLSERWNMDAREGTTREVLEDMEEVGFDGQALKGYGDMALAFDMVKYAKGRPFKDDIEKAREAAIDFIRLLAAPGDRSGTNS
jgi:hypothetical protein